MLGIYVFSKHQSLYYAAASRAKEDSFDKLSRLNNLFDVVSPSLHCYFYFSTFWTPPVSSKRTSWQRGEATLFVDSKLLSVQSKLCVTAWQWRSLGSGKEKLGTNLLLSQRITKENGVKTIAMLTLLLFFVKALVLLRLGLMVVHGILILDVYQLESSVSQSFFLRRRQVARKRLLCRHERWKRVGWRRERKLHCSHRSPTSLAHHLLSFFARFAREAPSSICFRCQLAFHLGCTLILCMVLLRLFRPRARLGCCWKMLCQVQWALSAAVIHCFWHEWWQGSRIGSSWAMNNADVLSPRNT